MKKLKLNSERLQLNKEKIAALGHENLNNVNGGMNEANPNNPSAQVTRGNCDIHTIGHDDGPRCLSASDWGWCWCHGI